MFVFTLTLVYDFYTIFLKVFTFIIVFIFNPNYTAVVPLIT